MARQPNTTTTGGSFDDATIEAVWKKGKPELGLTTYRKGAYGASMKKDKYGKRKNTVNLLSNKIENYISIK